MFLNGHQRPIYKRLGIRKFFRVLLVQKKSCPLKRFKVSYHLKFLGQNVCNSIRNYLSASLYNLSLSRAIFSFLLLTQGKLLRNQGSLVVKRSEHKGRVVLVWFRTCKRFLQDSEILKRVAWGLDIGTRVWPNQYKIEFALSLPLNSFIYYYLSFALRKFRLN